MATIKRPILAYFAYFWGFLGSHGSMSAYTRSCNTPKWPSTGLEIRKIWRWPKMATARVSAVAMATAKLAQQKWALLKWSLIQRSLHQFLNYWKAFWMGFIEFTKMAITSLKNCHFHPDFAQLWWPFFATIGLSGGGHCGGQLAWPPRISRPEYIHSPTRSTEFFFVKVMHLEFSEKILPPNFFFCATVTFYFFDLWYFWPQNILKYIFFGKYLFWGPNFTCYFPVAQKGVS